MLRTGIVNDAKISHTYFKYVAPRNVHEVLILGHGLKFSFLLGHILIVLTAVCVRGCILYGRHAGKHYYQ